MVFRRKFKVIGGDGSWVWLEGVRYGQRVVSGVGVARGLCAKAEGSREE